MKISPRWYQQEAHDACIAWIKKCSDSCIIEAPTGAGKSIIVAMLANTINKMSGKKILCLAPSRELVIQNHAKYLLTGEPASMFSASAGRKETKHAVVFGSPLTIVNNLSKFGGQYAAVIVDEADGITPTLKKIIDHMKAENPLLRVIGLTATPFRLGSGYIYRHHYIQGALTEETAIDPYYMELIYTIDARMLIAEGFLSQPVFQPGVENYDTKSLRIGRNGKFDDKEVDKAFVGQGRKTARIIADVVANSANKQGVMIFAATRQHAREIMESLPPELSVMVTGDLSKQDREDAINKFKSKTLKYIVNVTVLTVGFDAPHVDHVVIMRATESVRLLQQIIGRGLRVEDGKNECLVSDYAGNIERHCPDGDVFNPEIRATRKGESAPMTVICPTCGNHNEFAARFNPDGFDIDSEGYFVDLAGSRIEAEEGKFLPAHYGRRCQGFHIIGGRFTQCSHKWSFKICEQCGHENDIAARYCTKCRGELVNPNDRLIEEALKMEKDPYRVRFADVQMWNFTRWPGKDGKPESLRVEYMIADKPSTLMEWFHPESDSAWLLSKWNKFCLSAFGEVLAGVEAAYQRRFTAKQPEKIMFKKQKNSKYFDVVGLDFGVTD